MDAVICSHGRLASVVRSRSPPGAGFIHLASRLHRAWSCAVCALPLSLTWSSCSDPPHPSHLFVPPPPHRSLCAGASSHKTSSPSRILAFYYWRPVLTVVCLLNELFFLTLYLLRFLSVADPAHTPVAALAAVAAPVAVAKQVVSAWQVVAAHRLMGATGGRSG